jgi:hypothetical protein
LFKDVASEWIGDENDSRLGDGMEEAIAEKLPGTLHYLYVV